MSMSSPEQARKKKAREQYDALLTAMEAIVADYNKSYTDPRDQIRRLKPEEFLPREELGAEGKTFLFQRRNAFLKVLMEGLGSIQLAWGYRPPATMDLVFPEVNRLILDTRNEWKVYRFHGSEREHLERFTTDPQEIARALASRLVENSAVPPELIPSLAL